MSFEAFREAARRGDLYPGVIVHGGEESERREAALEIARLLLCDAQSSDLRPCGRCSHCKRIVWPEEASSLFHPDFRVLERDLKTVTSVAATKAWLQQALVRPFEARGQVFVIAAAETLSEGASNALLKILEEPPESAPRNFLLLTPSRLDLLPTVRSRCLSIFLGSSQALDPELLREVGREASLRLEAWLDTGAAVYLLALAETLVQVGGFEDPRAARPWSLIARTLLELAGSERYPPELRSALTELASDVLEAKRWRLRAVPPRRIVEGLLSRRLAALEVAAK